MTSDELHQPPARETKRVDRPRTGRAALWMLGLQALFVLVVFVPWLDREWLAHSGIPEVYTNLFVFGFFAIIPISLFVLLVGIATAKSDDRRGAVRGRIVIVGSIVVASAALFIIVRDAQDQLGY